MAETEKTANVELPRNPNEIRDTIFSALSLTEYTKVPVLFLGNPGIAKTTGVRLWSEMYGYKVTTLIGTQRVAEEILGYMVNDTGERRLITYTPDWFDEIQENKAEGYKTLLFVDELSQAPDNVQGAMLQLIFDRRVGGRSNFLPEDTVVVAAANYKGNIPPQCSIQAPTLNRFAIINIQPRDGIALVEEFTQSEDERRSNLPVFANATITPQIEESVNKILRETLTTLFTTYAKKDGQEMNLNINNQDFADMFDKTGNIYNFISGRSISYLSRIALGLIHLNIVRKSNINFVNNVVLGLVGLGTNTFNSERAQADYEFTITTAFQKLLRRAVESNMSDVNAMEISYKGKNIDKNISDWMRYTETASGSVNDQNLAKLIQKIKTEYPTTTMGMAKTIKAWDNTRMLNDLQKIDTLLTNLKATAVPGIQDHVRVLTTVVTAYEGYKAAALMELAN